MKTILVADDDPAVREVLQSLLEVVYRDRIASGALEVLTAEDGEEVAAIGCRTSLSLVLMDVNMPRLDGIEAFYRLMDVSQTGAVKTMFLTGYGSSAMVRERIDRAIEDGALGWLAKPVTVAQITAIIEEHVFG